jgi:hypothetical protein
MIGLRGVIGYAQRFSRFPAGRTWALEPTLAWIAALRLFRALCLVCHHLPAKLPTAAGPAEPAGTHGR